MSRSNENPRLGRELRDEELHQVSGGYDLDIEFCGTVPFRFPPRPGPRLETFNPVILNQRTLLR